MMVYSIRSSDGHVRICTASLRKAVEQVKKLRRQGRQFVVTDPINQKELSLGRLEGELAAVG